MAEIVSGPSEEKGIKNDGKWKCSSLFLLQENKSFKKKLLDPPMWGNLQYIILFPETISIYTHTHREQK